MKRVASAASQRAADAAIALLAIMALACSGCGPGAPRPPRHVGSASHATSAESRPSHRATTRTSTASLPLAGKIVGIDPGHNGQNFTHPAYIDRLIWNGRGWETCNTTGTETDSGYTEARFNFRVAVFLRQDLLREGARVVMTRDSNNGVGPCVNRRAAIINSSHADVAIDIHADGGPPDGRGFAVLEPVADGPNDHVITASERFGGDVRAAVRKYTSMPTSSYDGVNGITFRDNLAGLNLTMVPEVLIECGNMRNAADAALLTTTSFQERLALALASAIREFLTR